MKKRIILAGLALMVGLGTTQAQDAPWVSGRVIGGPFFDLGHRLMFSQNDNIYATSRATAMGGAFTSLGADLSSMSINPAGLGMYQSSDMGITAALTMDGMQTASPHMAPGSLSGGGSKTSFGLNNIGMAYNVFNSSGTLTSLTLGFSYNRVANFNSRTDFSTFGENSTIGEMFSDQINRMVGQGLPIDALNYDSNPWTNTDVYLEEWGAALGWQTHVVGKTGGGDYGFYTDAIPSDTRFRSTTKGGIHEYNFSVGANLGNYLYLGATVGFTEINYSEDTSYDEFYGSTVPLEYMWFDQNTRITGSGLTAKLGLVARPVEAVRIGVAFHLPTYYDLEKTYQGWMGTAEAESDTGTPMIDNLRFSTAPKLLTGVSAVIAERAIVALDWEMDWNNQIHSRGLSADRIEASKRESKELFNPAHTLRAGLEVRPADVVSLRLGGSWMGDFRRNKDGLFNPTLSDNPTIRSGFSVTAGLGFSLGRNGYFDLAYVYTKARMSDYDLWFYDDGVALGQWDASGSGEFDRFYSPIRIRHMITMTLGSRF